MVKMTPLAIELEAEPTVCAMLCSRIVDFTRADRRRRKAATVITATGIEVEIVRPARSPR